MSDPLQTLCACIKAQKPLELDLDAQEVVIDGVRYPADTETRWLERGNVDMDCPYTLDTLVFAWQARDEVFSFYHVDALGKGIKPILNCDRQPLLAYLRGESVPAFLMTGLSDRIPRWIELFKTVAAWDEGTVAKPPSYWQRQLGDKEALPAALLSLSLFVAILAVSVWVGSGGSVCLACLATRGVVAWLASTSALLLAINVTDVDRKRSVLREAAVLLAMAVSAPLTKRGTKAICSMGAGVVGGVVLASTWGWGALSVPLGVYYVLYGMPWIVLTLKHGAGGISGEGVPWWAVGIACVTWLATIIT